MTAGTGGVGINAPEASRLYQMEVWWNRNSEFQAYGRAHRCKQKRVVTVRCWVASNVEIDGYMHAKATIKAGQNQTIMKAILRSDDTPPKIPYVGLTSCKRRAQMTSNSQVKESAEDNAFEEAEIQKRSLGEDSDIPAEVPIGRRSSKKGREKEIHENKTPSKKKLGEEVREEEDKNYFKDFSSGKTSSDEDMETDD
jgi:hypothetical protein